MYKWDVSKYYINNQIKEIYSDYEQKKLLIYLEVLKNLENFIDKNNKKNNNKKFEKNVPAYHYDSECEYLHHDYEGITLPDNLSECSISEEKYRSWVENKLHIFKNNFPFFITLQIKKFGETLNCPEDDYKKNSGTTTYSQTRTLKELKEEAKNLLKEIQVKIPKHYSE